VEGGDDGHSSDFSIGLFNWLERGFQQWFHGIDSQVLNFCVFLGFEADVSLGHQTGEKGAIEYVRDILGDSKRSVPCPQQ
jgi:hypothetical protein